MPAAEGKLAEGPDCGHHAGRPAVHAGQARARTERCMTVEEPRPDTGRILALTDGVVAIAATLLVLDIHLPDGVTDVAQALPALVPKYRAWLWTTVTPA
jgi:Endosomal/lysosomal potassium channel TMEM175